MSMMNLVFFIIGVTSLVWMCVLIKQRHRWVRHLSCNVMLRSGCLRTPTERSGHLVGCAESIKEDKNTNSTYAVK